MSGGGGNKLAVLICVALLISLLQWYVKVNELLISKRTPWEQMKAAHSVKVKHLGNISYWKKDLHISIPIYILQVCRESKETRQNVRNNCCKEFSFQPVHDVDDISHEVDDLNDVSYRTMGYTYSVQKQKELPKPVPTRLKDVDDLLYHNIMGHLVDLPDLPILPISKCRECSLLQKQKESPMDPLAPPIPTCMLQYTPKCRERIRKQKERELVPTRQKVAIKNGTKIVTSSPLITKGLDKIATIGTLLLQVLVNCIVWGKCSWFILYLKHGRAKACNVDLAAALAIFRK